MLFEQTIAGSIELEGVGLHHGVPVRMKLRPAPAGTGIIFLRTDLENFALPASWQHVARVSYATSLMRQGVLISTTEHLLSVLYSIGIDNVWIEIDNLEVPILDGSGKPFVELIRKVGIERQKRRRRHLRVRRPVTVEQGDKRITLHPADHLSISCHIYFPHRLVGHQSMHLEVTPDAYAAEIAPARTFGFEHELDAMRDMGLIRGASLANAVCFAQDRVLNEEGLRFPDEPCRHKILDLMGDLALIGRPLVGKVVAERAGHAMHAALVSRIMQEPGLYELVNFEEATKPQAAAPPVRQRIAV
jgi:UDP-3-O-[3-hydroxymyristoyl] N-acetylglucosamine deacetylase